MVAENQLAGWRAVKPDYSDSSRALLGRSGLLRIDGDLHDRLVLRGVEGRHLRLRRAERVKVGASRSEPVVVGEGRAVAPGETVGGRRGLDRGRDVLLGDLD